ncbi:MAG: PDZ domain-containing protein [Mesorhizobium sp.]|nr:MAG: PDZ domain-containing protein [Mesorhizobium sp.]
MQFARALAASVKMTAVVSMAVPQTIDIAYASKYDLPKPYVSRALDAVLIPINHASRHRYQIPPKLRGVYVLAVAPHGVAARQGIRPGDVLAAVRHQPISTPRDVDRLVWAALAVSATSFLFGVNRGTDVVEVNTNITVNNFNTNISVNNISQWTSVDNREEWTQIVDEYDDEMETSLSDTSYRGDDSQPDDVSQDADASSPDADDNNSDDQNDSSDQNDDTDHDSTDDDTSNDSTDNDSADNNRPDDQDDSSDQNDDSTDGDASNDSTDDAGGSDDEDTN